MKKGWELKKLGEVCLLITRGIAPKYIEDGGISVINQKCIRAHQINYSLTRRHDVGLKKVPQERIIQSGDVLVNSTGTGTLGRIAQVQKEYHGIYTIDTHVTIVRPNETLFFLPFFGYALMGIEDELKESGDGCGGQTELSRSKIATNFSISYPKSLSEQQRIVEILDKAFVKIDIVKQNTERNLQNTKELFQSVLLQSLSQGQWITKNLNEITDVKDGTHDSPKYVEKGIPFVTQKNIKTTGLNLDDTKFITDLDHEKFYKRSDVAYGDILISMIGANRGMAAIVDKKEIFSIKNVGLIKKSENINQKFLLYYLKSPIAMKYVLDNSNGGAQEFIGLTSLRKFPIPSPPLSEQQQIVSKLDALSAKCKELENNYLQTIKNCDELKKTILAKAFNGEL